jgi:hypothetical protein
MLLRSIVLLCALMCCLPEATAQGEVQRVARVQLMNGEIVQGIVRRIDEKGMVLVIDGRERALSNAEIDRLLALGRQGERLFGLRAKREREREAPRGSVFAPRSARRNRGRDPFRRCPRPAGRAGTAAGTTARAAARAGDSDSHGSASGADAAHTRE